MESNLEKKLWKVFSEFIRLRDATPFTGYIKCFTCSRTTKHWKEMDCGHGVGRQHKSVKFNEVNNNGQCKHCNGFHGGRSDVYKTQMDKRYGEGTWNKMLLASRQIVKRNNVDFQIMLDYYTKERDRIKKEKKL